MVTREDCDDVSGHYYFVDAGSAKSRSFAYTKRLLAYANLTRFRTCARRLRERLCAAQIGLARIHAFGLDHGRSGGRPQESNECLGGIRLFARLRDRGREQQLLLQLRRE